MTLTEFHTEAVKIAEEFTDLDFKSFCANMYMCEAFCDYKVWAMVNEQYTFAESNDSPAAALQLFRAELEKIRATNNIDQRREDIIL